MKNILLIDDEEKLRSLLRLINMEGFEVIQAQDCKTATKKLK